MVNPISFIRPTTEARIKALRRRGLATTQGLQDPLVTVTFVERNPADSNKFTLDVATVALIRIRLNGQGSQGDVVNQGASESRITGTFKAWATDTPDIDKDQRFVWDDQDCRVISIEPERSGYTTGHFELMQRKVT